MAPPRKHLSEYKHGELAKEILKGLALGGFILSCFIAPNLAQVITLFKPRNSRERFKVKRVLTELQKRKLVVIKEKGMNSTITLTEWGNKRVLQYNIEELKIIEMRKWDGYWRLVTFDIPEKRRRVRREINFRLKDMGFIQFQDSVFVTPYECKGEIEFLSEYFFVRKYIKYILAKEIDDESKLKKIFKL